MIEMKKWILAVLLGSMLFLLPACSGGANETANQDGYSGAYKEILQTYDTALQEQWNPGQLMEEGLSVLLSYCYEGDPLSNVGYALLDVNGDDQEELIIGTIHGDEFVDKMVFALYTMTEDGPQQVFVGEERNRYYIMAEEAGGYFFANEGSNGAGNSVWYYTMLDGTELAVTQGIVYNDMAEQGGPWYMVYDMASQGSEEETVEESLAKSIIESYAKQYMVCDYEPFANK